MIDDDKRLAVFDKGNGECNYCEKELSLYNRDRQGRGAWEVEHRVPRAKGGTDHLNNLVPACWPCNIDKGTRTARTHHRAVAADRAARVSRRRWGIAGKAMIPGLAVAGLVWAYLRETGPSEQQRALMTSDERQRYFWKMLIVPALAGLATLTIIVLISEATRKS